MMDDKQALNNSKFKRFTEEIILRIAFKSENKFPKCVRYNISCFQTILVNLYAVEFQRKFQFKLFYYHEKTPLLM
jgi:hypothetical protein